MIDLEKWNVLTALVREARAADKAASAEMEAARLRWKAANETLTDRLKVLDSYVAEAKAIAIGVNEADKDRPA